TGKEGPLEERTAAARIRMGTDVIVFRREIQNLENASHVVNRREAGFLTPPCSVPKVDLRCDREHGRASPLRDLGERHGIHYHVVVQQVNPIVSGGTHAQSNGFNKPQRLRSKDPIRLKVCDQILVRIALRFTDNNDDLYRLSKMSACFLKGPKTTTQQMLVRTLWYDHGDTRTE